MEMRRLDLSAIRNIAGGGKGGSVELSRVRHKLSGSLQCWPMITPARPAWRHRHAKAGRNLEIPQAFERLFGDQPPLIE